MRISSDGTVAITDNLTVNGNQYPTAGALSNRNLVVNGAMQVAQRGTSATNLGNGDSTYHTVDRFRFGEQGAPTCEFTNTQSTDAPSGFSNSFRLDTTTAQSSIASGDVIYVDHRLEAQNLQQLAYGTSAAKSITISFHVKSTVTGTYAVWLYNQDGGVACTNTYTISSANTWEYKTFTVTGDTSNSINNDNGIGFFMRFVLCAGTNWTSGTASTTWGSASVTNANRFVGHTANVASSTSDDWSITGVQLEVGEKATPFEHRSYGDELLRCQRYCFKYAPSNQEWLYNESNDADKKWWHFYYPPMRDTPSFDAGTLSTGSGTGVVGLTGTISSISAGGTFGSGASGRQTLRVTMSAAGGTAYNIHHTDSWAGDHCFCFSEL
jgi:hypothetical protein